MGLARDGSVETMCRTELYMRVRRTETVWRQLHTRHKGMLQDNRTLAQMVDALEWNVRWPHPPIVNMLADALEPPIDDGTARAVMGAAAALESEGKPVRRADLMKAAANALMRRCVSKAMTERRIRVSAAADENAPLIDPRKVGVWRDLVSALSPQWAVTATRLPLSLWTTSTRLHDGVRDACVFGCTADDHLAHYLQCQWVRLLVISHEEGSDPNGSSGEVFGIGPPLA